MRQSLENKGGGKSAPCDQHCSSPTWLVSAAGGDEEAADGEGGALDLVLVALQRGAALPAPWAAVPHRHRSCTTTGVTVIFLDHFASCDFGLALKF